METGEVVEGPAYVLIPREDAVARSCMFAYAGACGLDEMWTRAVAMGTRESTEPLREYLPEKMNVHAEDDMATVSTDRRNIEDWSTASGGSGTLSDIFDTAQAVGYEFAHAVWRKHGDEERQKAAGERIKQKASAA